MDERCELYRSPNGDLCKLRNLLSDEFNPSRVTAASPLSAQLFRSESNEIRCSRRSQGDRAPPFFLVRLRSWSACFHIGGYNDLIAMDFL
jgi:hypothetical protein